jgi:hypothetical protein
MVPGPSTRLQPLFGPGSNVNFHVTKQDRLSHREALLFPVVAVAVGQCPLEALSALAEIRLRTFALAG